MASPSTQQPPVNAPVNPAPTGIPGPVITRPQVSASLYIGDLDPEVGESALYDLFKEIGNVASIRVCRDAITKVSLGYAYVNFHSVESAEKALDVLNGALLAGRPCRIMWSRRDPSIRKAGVGNIFIKNLSPDVDHATLYDIFSHFGNIYSCKLVLNKQGQSKGFGFVHFQTKEAAETAVKKMNNLKLNGKPVYVAPFISARERQRTNPDDVFTNVYVKNLPDTITEDEFNAEFSQYGDITSGKLPLDENSKPKGFGFVNYAKHEQAAKCVAQAHKKELKGSILYAARAQPRTERAEMLRKNREERANKYQGVNLYVKNLDDSVDEEKLRKPFSEFGSITSVKIMTDDKGHSKGFGFVCFQKPEEATKALTKMNNFMLEKKPLYVAIAQRKEQRRAQLEAQHAQRNTNMRLPGNMGMGVMPPYAPGAPIFYNTQNPRMFTTPYVGGPGIGSYPQRSRFPAGNQPGASGYGNAPYIGNPGANRGGQRNTPRGGVAGRPNNAPQPTSGANRTPSAPRPNQRFEGKPENAPADDLKKQLLARVSLECPDLEQTHKQKIVDELSAQGDFENLSSDEFLQRVESILQQS